MSSAPIVLPLFATPFGIVTVPEAEYLNPQLVDLFLQRTSRGPVQHANFKVYRSQEDLFNRTEPAARSR